MTVGIAALALGGTRIVLMSDKQFTGNLKIEEQTSKVMVLGNGWLAAFSGIRTFAQEAGRRANIRLARLATDSGGHPNADASLIADCVHAALLEEWTYAVNRDVLAPRFLSTETYREKDEQTRAEAEAAIRRYRDEGICDLLLCGFDEMAVGHIYTVGIEGHVMEMDFAAIGSGAGVAVSRLTWRGTRRSDALARVLYEVYEAKAHAEMDAFVGKDSDFFVMQANGASGVRTTTKETKALLDSVFRFHDQTPFGVRDGKRPKRPKAKWQAELTERLQGVLPPPTRPITLTPGSAVVAEAPPGYTSSPKKGT